MGASACSPPGSILLGICDRIAVMSRGLLWPAQDAATLTPQKIMHMAVA